MEEIYEKEICDCNVRCRSDNRHKNLGIKSCWKPERELVCGVEIKENTKNEDGIEE